MRHPEVHGGNGFATTTAGDLGFEPPLGATSADAKPVRWRTQTGPVCGGRFNNGGGLGGGGASAGRVSTGSAKRTRRKKVKGRPGALC